ncbi:hypothetical protein HPP92_001875 [Vanilla planifolia]|uniref:Uncharacterized protein n=1 Tax=Vanilla planifolia TaxID=51239 RepID=A0A835VDZ1_VANPL|nr:hypothetical protein HPP92_001875 [Vanilla planifolia]
MERYPVSLRKRQWKNTETDKLEKGIKQQYQEMLFLNSMNFGNDFSGGSIDSIIMSTFGGSDHQVTPKTLRSFLPLVNWDRLASMYLPQRSGPAWHTYSYKELFRDYPRFQKANLLINLAWKQNLQTRIMFEGNHGTNESWAKLIKRSVPSGELSLV